MSAKPPSIRILARCRVNSRSRYTDFAATVVQQRQRDTEREADLWRVVGAAPDTIQARMLIEILKGGRDGTP